MPDVFHLKENLKAQTSLHKCILVTFVDLLVIGQYLDQVYNQANTSDAEKMQKKL